MTDVSTPNGVTQPKPSTTGAVVGVGAMTVTGQPTAWLWNELLNWAVGGGLPIMPDPVAMFFGGLLMACGYGVYRFIQARRTAS